MVNSHPQFFSGCASHSDDIRRLARRFADRRIGHPDTIDFFAVVEMELELEQMRADWARSFDEGVAEYLEGR